MALRVGLVLLILSLALVAATAAFSFEDVSFEAIGHLDIDSMRVHGTGACNGRVGGCIDEDEEMIMASDDARRVLAQARHISYGAMKKNNVPCNKRGQSYYNCNQRQKANPYNRGCNQITRCGRANW